MDRKLAAILAADVVGYSALMERDERGTHERLTAGRRELFEPEIARHHGRVFKLMGDGMLAEFGSVVDAVECAVSLQRGLAERNAAVSEDQRVQLRIGINLGEVIVEGEDRYGEGVNIASRLEQLADPGGICVSGKVAKEVEKKLAFGFEPMGARQMKNIAEPVEAFRVKIDGAPIRRMAPVSPKRALPWAAAIAAVAVLAAIWFTMMKPAEAPGPVTDTAPVTTDTAPSIAVLPFANMGGDPAVTYFGDGVADGIINMLGRSPGLSVVAGRTSFAYKGKGIDARQAGKELGVRYVLEGSVRKEADRVRIVAVLVDAKTGENVWAEHFDKTGIDPLALQDEVTGRIVASLIGSRGELERAEYRDAWGKDTANLAEYDYALRGGDYYRRDTSEALQVAGAIWQEGLAKFPNSALLQINVGWFHFRRLWSGWNDEPGDLDRARELLQRVHKQPRLTPYERRSYVWLRAYINLLSRDFEKAVKDAELAIAFAPHDAFAKGDLATVLIPAGKPQLALEWIEWAMKRDPANAGEYNDGRGWALLVLQRDADALEAFKAGNQRPGFNTLFAAIAEVHLGHLDRAEALVRKVRERDSHWTLARWRQLNNVYSDLAILEREIAALAKAGLPEK